MIPYMGLTGLANNYNEVNTADQFFGLGDTYDMCSGTAYVAPAGVIDLTGTGWTAVFGFNAYLYLTMLILTACMLICILIPGVPIQLIGCAYGCVMCTGIPVLAGAILAAVRRNSDAGAACAVNTASVDYADDPTITF